MYLYVGLSILRRSTNLLSNQQKQHRTTKFYVVSYEIQCIDSVFDGHREFYKLFSNQI